jgi:hypothetical protein
MTQPVIENRIFVLMRNIFQKICDIIIIIILFSFFAYCKTANCAIEGIVFDKETHKPVCNANVYLAYTLTGSSTDKYGHYCIEKVNPGKYFLVVSHVAYEDLDIHIMINENEKVNYNFHLLPKVYQLKPIIVLADSSQWKKRLKRFLKEFLGTSKNSERTSIKNTEVLDFELKGSKLFASAQVPLEIINKSLGYKIIYSLYHFESTFNYVKYTGFPKFIELKAEYPEILDNWKTNRKNTYAGSLRHFLNTICLNYDLTSNKSDPIEFEIDYSDKDSRGYRQRYKDDNILKQNGFEVLYRKSRLKSRMYLEDGGILANTNDYLKPAENTNEMYLKFDNYLEICYTNPGHGDNKSKSDDKISWIKLETDSIIIDRAGRYYETFSIKTAGFWSFERISDILPFEYIYENSDSDSN